MWEWVAQVATKVEVIDGGFRLTSYGQISNHDASEDSVIFAEGATKEKATDSYIKNVSAWRGWNK